jgi:uncharacterized phage protein (TIGR01671 family)
MQRREMKDINFRAWDKFRKRMLLSPHIEFFDNEWSVECVSVDEQMKEAHEKGQHACSNCGIDAEWGDLKRVDLMQSTGKADFFDGKDIYVKDILEFQAITKYGKIKKTGIVRCDSLADGCSVHFLPHELDAMPLDFEVVDPRIIGNEYETPELLKDSHEKEKT